MLASETQTLAALFQARRYQDIERLAADLVARHPDFGFGWKSLAAALQFQGKDALEPCLRAVELLPAEADGYLNLGNALRLRGRLEAAARSFRQAIDLKPGLALAHANLGNVLRELGQAGDAVQSCRHAIEIDPGTPMAHLNLGVALDDLGQLEEAAQSYRRAVKLKPDLALAHANLGNVLRQMGQAQEGVRSCQRALTLNPRLPQAHLNLAVALEELGRIDEAMKSYRRALALDPELPKARFGLGICHLLKGELRQGWPLYEHYERVPDPAQAAVAQRMSFWHGEPVEDARGLLVFAEQGFGDSLHFSRYLPLVAERFARVGFVCPEPLVRLFRLSFPAQAEILETAPSDCSAWSRWIPLPSLPRAFDTILETIPNTVPYLAADPREIAAWRSRFAAIQDRRSRVGLVWAGSKELKLDARRSLPLARLAPLLKRHGVNWVSLQTAPQSQQRAQVPAASGMIDWMDEIDDFAATAALVSALDLVIAVDTAVAHLAGALGKPVWLLNRFESEWRWMRDREDSPWYPTMRIFSQRRAGDWDEVVARIGKALDTQFPEPASA